MANLERAIEIAIEAHKNQKDKNGEPYIQHPLRVMNMGRTDEEKIVGVIHDVVEDSDWTFEDFEREGFSTAIIDALRCVTKQSEDEDYKNFINRIKPNSLAVKVKLNDLIDNMDIRRMKEVKEKDVARLNKYLWAYRELIQL